MTAVEHVGEAPQGVPEELLAGAQPRVISAYLLPEDRERFGSEYRAALSEAHSPDDPHLRRVVEHWRRIAALQADPESFRESVRAIAEVVTGEPTPNGESFEFTRKRAGI